jgi:hypothetical protein
VTPSILLLDREVVFWVPPYPLLRTGSPFLSYHLRIFLDDREVVSLVPPSILLKEREAVF